MHEVEEKKKTKQQFKEGNQFSAIIQLFFIFFNTKPRANKIIKIGNNNVYEWTDEKNETEKKIFWNL